MQSDSTEEIVVDSNLNSSITTQYYNLEIYQNTLRTPLNEAFGSVDKRHVYKEEWDISVVLKVVYHRPYYPGQEIKNSEEWIFNNILRNTWIFKLYIRSLP